MELWSEEFFAAVNPRVVTVGADFAMPNYKSIYRGKYNNDFFDLIYVEAGHGQIHIDDNKLTHNPGDIIFIKPGQHIRFESASSEDPYREYFAYCYIFEKSAHSARKLFIEACPQKINIKNKELAVLFEDLFKAFSIDTANTPLKLRYKMLNIMDIVFYNIQHGSTEIQAVAYDKILKACEFIKQRYNEKMTLDMIAEHVDISSSYLLAGFKKYINCSPIAYKMMQQVNNAKLLLARNVSVSDTAKQAGFESLHYFSRTFRKKTGMSPTQFAQACRRKISLR